jgi:glycogen debranching enzyme
VSRHERVSVLDGDTFVVSDLRGDIDASPTAPEGLFSRDTRFLSRWRLTVDGQTPGVLSTDDLRYNEVQFFLVPTSGTIYVDSTLSVRRVRRVADGVREELTVVNHAAQAVDVQLRLEAAADFADLFEVKDALPKKGELYRRVEPNALVLGYRRHKFVRETRIETSAPATIDERGLGFRIHLAPHASFCVTLTIGLFGSGWCRGRARARPRTSRPGWRARPSSAARGRRCRAPTSAA